MSEKKSNSEIRQNEVYCWEVNGVRRELLPADPENTDYTNFRAKEAKEVMSLLQQKKQLTFIRVNSGYGVSKFLLPKLREYLKRNNIKYDDASYLEPSKLDSLNKQVKLLIVDEMSGSRNGVAGGCAILNEILAKRPNLQALVLFDDETSPHIKLLIEKYDHTGQLARGEIRPKLLNVHEAAQYALFGDPLNKAGAHDTIFEGLNLTQSEQLIKIFAARAPLQFHLVERFRHLLLFSPRKMSFEDKLKNLAEGTFDYEINGFIEADAYFNGIKKK